jgi:hypothetical protein
MEALDVLSPDDASISGNIELSLLLLGAEEGWLVVKLPT